MRTLNLNEMENVNGGKVAPECGVALAGALIFGTLGVIAAASGPIGWLAVAMAGNYFGWGMAAWTCSK